MRSRWRRSWRSTLAADDSAADDGENRRLGLAGDKRMCRDESDDGYQAHESEHAQLHGVSRSCAIERHENDRDDPIASRGGGHYFDIAVRDVAMAIAAFTLARLTEAGVGAEARDDVGVPSILGRRPIIRPPAID